MESLCIECELVIRGKQHRVKCARCKCLQHRVCDTGMLIDIYIYLLKYILIVCSVI